MPLIETPIKLVKIKLDENLSDRLVVVLTALGHNVDTVRFPEDVADDGPTDER